MHWSELMARKAAFRDFVVEDDVECIACGYNLRSLRAGARCPECGRRVMESLQGLRHPDRVAGVMRDVSRSYVLTLAAFQPLALGCGVWFGLLLLVCACMMRVFATGRLRFGCELEGLAAVRSSTGWMFWTALLEATGVAALAGLLFAGAVSSFGAPFTQFSSAACFSLLSACVGIAGAAISICVSRVAAVMPSDWIRDWIISRLKLLSLLFVASVVLTAFALALSASAPPGVLAGFIAGAAWCVTLFTAFIRFQHLATALELNRGGFPAAFRE